MTFQKNIMSFSFILSVTFLGDKGSSNIVFYEAAVETWMELIHKLQYELPLTDANLAVPEFLNHKKREKCLAPGMVTCLKNLDRPLKPINYI